MVMSGSVEIILATPTTLEPMGRFPMVSFVAECLHECGRIQGGLTTTFCPTTIHRYSIENVLPLLSFALFLYLFSCFTVQIPNAIKLQLLLISMGRIQLLNIVEYLHHCNTMLAQNILDGGLGRQNMKKIFFV